jgi:hypothetical protein
VTPAAILQEAAGSHGLPVRRSVQQREHKMQLSSRESLFVTQRVRGGQNEACTRSLPVNYIPVTDMKWSGDVSWETQSLHLADFNVRLATDGHVPDQ